MEDWKRKGKDLRYMGSGLRVRGCRVETLYTFEGNSFPKPYTLNLLPLQGLWSAER